MVPRPLVLVLSLLALACADDPISPESWMHELYGARPQTLLRDVVIPGTHDAATYGISASSDVAKGQPFIYNLAKPVVAGWSLTQHRTTAEQLRDGIRYLDLRVTEHRGELVIVHGMISVSLLEVLQEVEDFCAAQPEEIVILDFQEMPGKAHRESFNASLQKVLGARLVPDSFAADSVTFGQLWDAGKSVICLLKDGKLADAQPHFWKRSRQFTHTWANATDLERLRGRLEEDLAERDRDRFLCSFLTFTPEVETIIQKGLMSGEDLQQLSSPLVDKPGLWIPDWLDRGLPVNIVAADFYDTTDLVSACLAANLRLLEE